ncbi:transketolase [Rhodotorula sp. JG-1b]|nr:transketolase [Rhodotorula sp. JG-1b]
MPHATPLPVSELKSDENPKVASDALVLATIRCLAADIVQAYKGGHAGTPMGAAAIGVALFREAMRYNPRNPLWLNRDRFVLSAGHACLLQYINLMLAGYEAWTLDEVKRYHSRDFKTSKAAGHPEIEQECGIEVTTGPLGQGIANSVGLAIAAKQLAAQYNKPEFDIVSNKIWCFTGDGCLQEGVGQEAISVAGHFGLDNLILVYDCNKITVDGTIDNCFTEDVPLRFQAAGWNVIDAGRPENEEDAAREISTIADALQQARKHTGAPTLVIVRTTIGFGSRKQDTGPAHGQALGDEEVAYVKEKFRLNPEERFVVPESVRRSYAKVIPRGAALEQEWNDIYSRYAAAYPTEANELSRRVAGELPPNWQSLLPTRDQLPTAPQPTRKSSGIVVEALASKFPDFVAGSADLLESTFVSWKGMTEFQKPSSGLGDFAGRQIRYGIREHSMAAIANGLAAYLPQSAAGTAGFIPIISTFFMFTLYAAPALRMAALQKLRTITVATHDSLGIGEDGPTHQPVALASFFRALPGLRLWRPADAEEVMAAWQYAIEGEAGPSVLCFSRQAVPLLEGSRRDGAIRGAYTLASYPADLTEPPRLVLIGTGSEVALAVSVAKRLSAQGVATSVVSMPCMELFDKQSIEYKRQVLPSNKALVVAIEAWSSFGWARYAHASVSMHTFGHSGPQADLFEMFGFGEENVAKIVSDFVDRHSSNLPGVGEFEELLLRHVAH